MMGRKYAMGRNRQPNSHSVKAWARYLARHGRAPINIRNPDRYLNSYARGLLGETPSVVTR